MKEIKLSKSTAIALVDDEDYEMLSQWNWSEAKSKRSGTSYAYRRFPIEPGSRKYKTLYMHNVVLNTPKGMVSDHKNRNGLDNRRSNLRVCTTAENTRNRGKRSDSKHKYIGIVKTYGRRKARYLAQVKLHGKAYKSKSFITEEEAAREYDKMAKELHGEFASLNFP